ncbi:AraC family transcriptional regulator [Philodulcilactobacillus myokoensis]|uniref:AraC family transcriptional regulator n=1 Tax=Philodulcilactobacillus myokoensis TaxID=2929573 RepID=A0A9W6ESF3_9LACO|nr:AraC family transcriptional regulator [Philodulcilactobacillus myokoensis]GLB46089.1 AraC family transcriptional regulator [Philodulcilactobacillus myokoensis]
MKNYILDGQYLKYFQSSSLDIHKVLKQMNLPFDFFNRKYPSINERDYYRFMKLIGNQINNPNLPIKLATDNNVKTFSPSIFASYCSKDGIAFINRIAQYKRLIAPIKYEINQNNYEVNLKILPSNNTLIIPKFLLEIEMIFVIHIIRSATNKEIIPQSITSNFSFDDKFSEYVKCKIINGAPNQINFNYQDLKKPFISYNQSMLDFFKPVLKKQLNNFNTDNSCAANVQNALVKLLPSGQYLIENVANELNISKRTLQRELKNEKTSFREQLNHTRKLLAENYLRNTDMSTYDVAFLLGYQELNSFLRAFSSWTGNTISDYKKGNINK